jgi:trimethylamine--corrinoid protein Co-methyltransferase
MKFFSDTQLRSIHDASLQILDSIGLSEAPEEAIKLICDNGGSLTDSGRLTFPEKLVNEGISSLRKSFIASSGASLRPIESRICKDAS